MIDFGCNCASILDDIAKRAQTRKTPVADKLPDEPHASQQDSPTKSELLERHWLEYLKGWNTESHPLSDPSEGDFWRWYIDNHLTEDK